VDEISQCKYACLTEETALDMQFVDQDVIVNGIVSDSWSPSSHSHLVDEFEGTSYFWLEPSEGETIGELQLFVTSGKDVSNPELLTEPLWDFYDYYEYYEYYEQSFGTELEVVYHCQRQGVVTMTLSIPVNEDNGSTKRLEVSWEKSCGSGVRFGLQVGTVELGNDVVEDGETKPEWKSGESVPAAVTLSTFYLSMEEGFGTQTYSPPQVSSSNPHVLVHSRGYASIANSISEEDYAHELTIVYECVGTGKATITVRIDIPPYSPVTWNWEKVCGGEIDGALEIGLSRGTSEVVRDGKLVESFKDWVSKATERKTDFFLYMSEDVKQIYEAILVTSSPGGVLRPVLEVDGSEPGYGFITGEPSKLTIFYGCLKKGDATVTVTIVLPPYKMIEFSWHKRCVRLSPTIDESVWTANQLLTLICVLTLAVVVSAFFIHRYTRQQNRKLNR